MKQFYVLLVIFSGYVCYCNELQKHAVRKFPDNFLLGTSTSAYQIEGAWNKDGKSESIWDRLVHSQPSPVRDNSTGDVSADSYHLYKRDVEMLRELGVDFYRFSLSWPRILPTGYPDQINQAGVDYYNNLINELLKYNIEPMITLYHWDLPQKLQDLGGWPNPYVVDWYADYARIAFELFGDRVKYWITINEPQLICYFGYGRAYSAPRFTYSGDATYMCAKNILLAHAKAYHIYDKEFRHIQDGTIFISINAEWTAPASEEHVEAAEDRFQFDVGLYAHPIFSKTGGWPATVVRMVDAKSAEQGFFRSRLPSFKPEEIDYIRGTSDIFGLNHYSTYLFYRNASTVNKYPKPSLEDDVGVGYYQPNEWSYKEGDFVKTVPWGFYELLKKLKTEYDNPCIFVTENGYGTRAVGLEDLLDEGRVGFYRKYISAMLDAIDEGSNVIGYTAWSFLDNFEWIQGYTIQFGLYNVDFSTPARTRTPRKSAFVFKEIIRSRTLDLNYDPDITTMTIDDGH